MPARLARPVKIGTDCSGMETPIMALKKLKVPYEHMFSCDIDPNVKTQIMKNFPPKVWFDNLMARDNTASSTPQSDIYVAGFPCQPFSCAGLGKGFKDKRGKVFYGCAEYIDEKRPRVFILENVKMLFGHDKGKTFKHIMACLHDIGKGAYEVQVRLLNSLDHGVPQSRPRIYIVGIRKDCKVAEFTFPEPLPRVSIEAFLDPIRRKPKMDQLPRKSHTTAFKNVRRVLKRLTAEGAAPLKNTYCVDAAASPDFCGVMKDRTMCLTKSRTTGFWLTSRGRYMRLNEMLRFQGMERSFKQVVPDRALGGQIGNAMGQNILERLLVKLLPAAGLVSQGRRLRDRWAAAAKKTSKKAKRKSSSNEPAKKRARKA